MREALARWWRVADLDDAEKASVWSTDHVKLHGGVQILFGAGLFYLTGGIAGWWATSEALAIALLSVCAVLVTGLHLLSYGAPPSSLKHSHLGWLKANAADIPYALAYNAAFLAWAAIGWVCMRADWYDIPPVSTVGLWLFASLLVCDFWKGTYLESELFALPDREARRKRRRRRLSRHYLIMAACVLATSLLPLCGSIPAYWLYANGAVFGSTVALLMIVGGALDQRILNRLVKLDRGTGGSVRG